MIADQFAAMKTMVREPSVPWSALSILRLLAFESSSLRQPRVIPRIHSVHGARRIRVQRNVGGGGARLAEGLLQGVVGFRFGFFVNAADVLLREHFGGGQARFENLDAVRLALDPQGTARRGMPVEPRHP